jgi:carbamoyltransferase
MNVLGISAGFHDAGVSVIRDGEILFAAHAERYSKKKHDEHLNADILNEALAYGKPDIIAFYEKPWLKKLRQLYAGQYDQALDFSDITVGKYLAKHCPTVDLGGIRSVHIGHHHSHAAAGFQTSPFDRATVVVIDAIGEWDTISIWAAEYVNGQAKYTRLWGQRYPHSIGLFYSAITKRVNLRPMDEEYILMGMAGYGEPGISALMQKDFIDHEYLIKFKQNLHLGVDDKYLEQFSDMDLAAGAQDLAEQLILNVMVRARLFNWSKNLVYMGGVALNCSANRRIGNYFENIWIMPNPGDCGSSLGAAAMAFGGRVNWRSAFLGHDIPGPYPVNGILDRLLAEQIVGVASGRAEFGPRALGNRSLLADPRGSTIKEKVNEIKRRQQFRPFAPVIMEELADHYFDMPSGFSNSRYMQSVARCRYPDLFPAIVHVDGTSRVQTVPRDGSGIRELLEKWYVLTDCPMLLNTSLNIRGEPMVDDRADADRFEQLYGVKVCS